MTAWARSGVLGLVPDYVCHVSEPSETAVKTLFAHSRNKCFFTRCEEDLTKEGWKQVNAEIAHIKGERDGSARWERTQPDKERQGYTNLMLLCPKHHKLIDRLEPDKYTVEVLAEMRERHLDHAADQEWCTEEQALNFARFAIAYWSEHRASGLQIRRAEYGQNETYANVTELVRSHVVGDTLELQVSNETMGGDPLENVVKELRVDYQLNDNHAMTSIAEENTTIVIPPPQVT